MISSPARARLRTARIFAEVPESEGRPRWALGRRRRRRLVCDLGWLAHQPLRTGRIAGARARHAGAAADQCRFPAAKTFRDCISLRRARRLAPPLCCRMHLCPAACSLALQGLWGSPRVRSSDLVPAVDLRAGRQDGAVDLMAERRERKTGRSLRILMIGKSLNSRNFTRPDLLYRHGILPSVVHALLLRGLSS